MKKKGVWRRGMAGLLAAVLSVSSASTAFAQGWELNGSQWKYVEQNEAGAEEYAKSGWRYINGKWYYFDTEGIMKTGWVQDHDGKWYYLDPAPGSQQGSMMTGWVFDEENAYFLGADGAWIENYSESDDESSDHTVISGDVTEEDSEIGEDSEKPGYPSNPDNPENPALPNNPDNPENPNNPNNPDNPENPNNPDNPEEPVVFTVNERVKAFDASTDEGLDELGQVYELLYDYWTDDMGTDTTDDDEYNVVVGKDSPLYQYILDGSYVTEDIIYIPACEFFPTGVSLVYLYHDDEYGEAHDYDAEAFELIHTRMATLGDIIGEDIHVSFDSLDNENPVSFVWIPEYIEIDGGESGISLLSDGEADGTLLQSGMNYMMRSSGQAEAMSASNDDTKSNAAQIVEGLAEWGDQASIKSAGFQPQNLLKVVPKADFSSLQNGKIGLDFSKIIIYDRDGKNSTKADRITLDGELSMEHIRPEVGIDWELKASDQFLPQQVIGKLSYTENRDVKLTVGGELGSLAKVMKDFKKNLKITHDNKREIFGMTINGIDMGDTAVLGAVGLNLGTSTVKFGIKSLRNQSIAVGLAPTIIVMFIADMNGNVSTTVVAQYQQTSYIEKGFNVQKTGYVGNHGTCAQNVGQTNATVLGRQVNIYNLTAKSASAKNLKPTPVITVAANGTANVEAGIGGAIGIMCAGVIPAQVKYTIGPEANATLNGSVKGSENGIELKGEGSLNAALVAKGTADVRLTAKTFLGEPGISGSWDFGRFVILQMNLSTSTLKGQVFESDSDRDESNNPVLSGAKVSLKQKNQLASTSGLKETTTDSDGKFSLNNLAAGDYTFTVSKDGYLTYTADLTIEANNGEQNIYLDKDNQKGSLSGIVMKADSDTDLSNNECLSGVKVTATKVGSSTTQTKSVQTGSDGKYELLDIPVGLYELLMEKDDYISIRNEIQVTANGTTYNQTMEIIDNLYAGMGVASGTIFNAKTGGNVGSGITLYVYGGVGLSGTSPITSTTTDGSGQYQLVLPAGNYTAVLKDERTTPTYQYSSFTFKVLGSQTIGQQNGTMTPLLNVDELRIVLTWGSTPNDLDSHLTGPTASGGRFHTFYSQKTYSESGLRMADLDVDDVSSYGPETTTIYRMQSGIYRFAVHNYTNKNSSSSYALSNSGAEVTVYKSGVKWKTYHVPSSVGGTVWNVFDYDSRNGQITPLNTMQYISSPSSVASRSSLYRLTAQKEELKDYELAALASMSNAEYATPSNAAALTEIEETATGSNAIREIATGSNASKETETATGSNAQRSTYKYDEEDYEEDYEDEIELIYDLIALFEDRRRYLETPC